MYIIMRHILPSVCLGCLLYATQAMADEPLFPAPEKFIPLASATHKDAQGNILPPRRSDTGRFIPLNARNSFRPLSSARAAVPSAGTGPKLSSATTGNSKASASSLPMSEQQAHQILSIFSAAD